jgi:hypothetical protein
MESVYAPLVLDLEVLYYDTRREASKFLQNI